MKLVSAFVLALSGAVSAGTASAQVLGFATAPPGSIAHSMGSAIAKVANEKADLHVVVQPQQSQGQLIVDAGSAELSLATAHDLQFFVTGTGDWAGRGRKENIRIIGRIVPIRVGILVRKDSDIRTMKDIKGKRIGGGFPAMKAAERGMSAYLANAGLSYDDVQAVPTQNVITAANDFAAGKTDAFLFALGAAKVKEVAATVGGLRALPIDPSPAAIARAQTLLPGSYAYVVEPSPALPEVAAATPIIAYDFVLFTRKGVADDEIFRLTKALYESKADLAAVFKPFVLFVPDRMARPYAGLTYHPGAIKFYQQKGLWPPQGN